MAKHAAPEVPDLSGQVAIVTGANTGIGKATALALARARATVVLTARDEQRGEKALTDIRRDSGNDDVHVMALDHASFASVRDFAEQFRGRYSHLDVLVNNAGVMLSDRQTTGDGNETTLQVNHLGPFLLTRLLRDPLAAAHGARVVNVSSDMHTRARKGIDFDDLQLTRHFNSSYAYARTKLANILFTRELARRWADAGIDTNAVHPGFVRSGFGQDGDMRGIQGFALGLLRPFAISPEQGASTSVYVASAPELAGVTGGFFARCAPAQPSRAAQDDTAAARLWAVSEELTGLA
jgi:NAD(P)-dependent dehydrogenase (short-subunit alcohol dehydrogenase family)